MEFEAISATRMIALMLVGAAFAFAGLYMMLRPRPEGAAKIELFGLKFESSSAGLLVFMVGAAFLAVTLFVPERQTGSDQIGAAPKVEVAGAKPKPDTPAKPKVISEGAVIKETEPNNGIREAQPLAIGQVAAGKFGKGSGQDWFTVSFPNGDIALHEVKLRHVHGNIVSVRLYDVREQEIGKLSTNSGAAYFSLEDQTTETIYIKTSGAIGGWDTDTYEVSVAQR
jgi:hypothetical protein